MGKERVVMLWDADLKARVSQAAGPRGLTTFVVAAVQDRLENPPAAPDPGHLADAAVDGGGAAARPTVAPTTDNQGDNQDTKEETWSEPLCSTCGNPLVDGECWTC